MYTPEAYARVLGRGQVMCSDSVHVISSIIDDGVNVCRSWVCRGCTCTSVTVLVVV